MGTCGKKNASVEDESIVMKGAIGEMGMGWDGDVLGWGRVGVGG